MSGHLGNADYNVSHVIDICLQVHPTPPNSALALPSHPAPLAGEQPQMARLHSEHDKVLCTSANRKDRMGWCQTMKNMGL